MPPRYVIIISPAMATASFARRRILPPSTLRANEIHNRWAMAPGHDPVAPTLQREAPRTSSTKRGANARPRVFNNSFQLLFEGVHVTSSMAPWLSNTETFDYSRLLTSCSLFGPRRLRAVNAGPIPTPEPGPGAMSIPPLLPLSLTPLLPTPLLPSLASGATPARSIPPDEWSSVWFKENISSPFARSFTPYARKSRKRWRQKDIGVT